MRSRPVRLLFVIPDLRFGGAERHLATLLPNLDRAKFAASVICIGGEGELFAEVIEAGVHAEALQMGGKRNALRALSRLVSHMRMARPDVVFVQGYNAEMLGRIAALMAHVKHSVVWVHDVGDIERRSLVRELAGRALMRTTSRHFGVAEAQRQYIVGGLHCPADKLRIVHNGVDPSLYAIEDNRDYLSNFGIDADDFVVGIVAALRPEKDHETLLRATVMLLKDLPRTKVLVVGDGPERARLEDLSTDLGIAENVVFTGSRGDVRWILPALDVVVLCSVTECFPLSVLEAMACARPVVCSDVGGVGEMVQNGVTGYLIPPREPRVLSDRLRDVLSDTRLAHRMGQAGRRRVEYEFTLARSVAAIEEAIQEVVGLAGPVN